MRRKSFSNQRLWACPTDNQVNMELLQMKSCLLGLFLILGTFGWGYILGFLGTPFENRHFTASLGAGYCALTHSTQIRIPVGSFL